MKLSPTGACFRILSLCALLFGACCGTRGQAGQTFTYAGGDLLIGLRQTAGGLNDVLINAGPVANFTNLPVGGKIVITSLTGTLLNSALNSTNGLSWSAFACFDTSATYPLAVQDSLFMTRARANVNTQSTAWKRYTDSAQGNVVAKINGVGDGGTIIGGGLPAGVENTPTVLVEPEANAKSYRAILGAALNWGGTFQGNPEQTTSDTFSEDGLVVRADFYWLLVGGDSTSHPAGTYLGYFELSPRGVLTYTAGPSPSVLVPPSIVSVVRTNGTTTVAFTTVSGSTYTLLASNDLSAPLVNWAAVGTAVTGNGLTNAISEANASPLRFYRIKAQ